MDLLGASAAGSMSVGMVYTHMSTRTGMHNPAATQTQKRARACRKAPVRDSIVPV